jgi:hypothetical protein
VCIKGFVEHKANPLHIYCRVKNILLFLGFGCNSSSAIAKCMCRGYEKFIFRPILVALLGIDMSSKILRKGR